MNSLQASTDASLEADVLRMAQGLTPLVAEREQAARWLRVRSLMKSARIDAVFAYGSPLEPKFTRHLANYVPPFVLGEAFVVIVVSAKEPTLLIDAKWFLQQAREMTQLRDVRVFPRPALASQSTELVTVFSDVIHSHGLADARVGFLPLLTPTIYRDALAEALPHGQVVDATALMNDVLDTKSDDDRTAIRKAAAVGDEAMRAALEACGDGVPEYEVGLAAQRALAMNGADIGGGVTLRSHVMVGLSSRIRSNVRPYDYTSRMMRRGDMFFIDVTASYRGYCTDLCRTVVVGPPSRGQQRMYECVLAMHDALLSALRPGVDGNTLWHLAADVARQSSFSEEDLNAVWLGHGIGFSVAEPPFFVAGESREVKEGTFFAVEPGILRADGGQAVVEDVVFVSSEGAQMVTTTTRELFVADGT